jgi:hypothetical protein
VATDKRHLDVCLVEMVGGQDMTRDDIIRLAREAGLWPAVTDVFPKELERFAALVAAHEREECARICNGYNDPLINTDAAAAIRSRT